MHPWAIDAFRNKVQRLTAEIEASSDEFQVTAPTDELATAASSSTAAARRLLLLGGEGGALLLAFTILAAAALRRDVTDARRRLVWFGARRWQVELHTLAESLALAAAGTVVGWIARRSGRRASSRRAPARRSATCSSTHFSRPAACSVPQLSRSPPGLLLYATVRAPAVHLGRLAVTPLDAAALGAIAVVLVGWARGSVDSQQLTGGSGTSAFLLLVPALIVFAAAVIAARLLAPTLRALGRAGPPRADRAAPRCRVAGAQSGPRCDRRDVPRREPRARAVRRHVPLDAAARPERRGALRGTGVVRALGGPLAAGAGPARRAARQLPRAHDAGAPPVRQRTVGNDVLVPRAAGESRHERRRLACRLRFGAARLACPRDHTQAQRRAPLDHPPRRSPVLAARDREGRRHRRARTLPLAARRLRGGRARPHERRAADDPARAHPVHRRNARAAPARHPEPGTALGERRPRPAAECERRGHVRRCAGQREAAWPRPSRTGSGRAASRAARRGSATSSPPTRTASSDRVSRPTACRCPCSQRRG